MVLAERSEDTAILGYALNARHFALWRPQGLADRIVVADRIVDLANRAGDRELALAGRMWRIIDLLELGAFHGLEIGYVFGSIPPPSANDQYVGEKIQEYWSNFALKGKPKATAAKGWPRFKSKSWKMLRLHFVFGKLKDFKRAECEFWSGLYEEGNL